MRADLMQAACTIVGLKKIHSRKEIEIVGMEDQNLC
jgi:hypothetical protein